MTTHNNNINCLQSYLLNGNDPGSGPGVTGPNPDPDPNPEPYPEPW